MTEDLYYIGVRGKPAVIVEGTTLFRSVLGYKQLLKTYISYEEQGWQEDMDIAKTDGMLTIGWEGVE